MPEQINHRLWCAAILAGLCSAQPPSLPGYALIPELSDEFDGARLDPAKWSTARPVLGWAGRAPGLFDASNVAVADGKLQLWARAARRNASWPAGFDNYTTAAVRSLASARTGYFEVRWRSGSSAISSSWWFHTNNGSAWTEIDVFETTGASNDQPAPGEDVGDPDRCRNTPLNHCRSGCPANRSGTCGPAMLPFAPGAPSCNLCACNAQGAPCSASHGAKDTDLPSHVHVFKLPGVAVDDLPAACGGCTEGTPHAPPCSKAAKYAAPTPWSAGFHTASLNWTTDADGLSTVAIGVDGATVSTITSPCLGEEIGMDFDRETMPGWMALPDPATLPDQPFEVDWVRSYRQVATAEAGADAGVAGADVVWQASLEPHPSAHSVLSSDL